MSGSDCHWAINESAHSFSVYFRKLNAVTIFDLYPLPCMAGCLDSLGEKTVISTLDGTSGYWQVESNERDRNNTVTKSNLRLYSFTGMPLRLKNVPAKFQKASNVIHSWVPWKLALAYLHDDFVSSKPFQNNKEQVRRVSRLLYKDRLPLKSIIISFLQRPWNTQAT